MRKNISITLIVLALLVIGGCQKKVDTYRETNDSLEEATEIINETAESVADILESTAEAIEHIEESDICYQDMLPISRVIFENGDIEIVDPDGGEYYIYTVSNYTIDEFDVFVTSLKEMGWTDVNYETENAYGAYSEDGEFWVQIDEDVNEGLLYVVCNKSKH